MGLSPEHVQQALEGRRRGLAFSSIAATLKADEDEVRAAVSSALAAASNDLDVEQERVLALSRIDRMLAGAWPRAVKGEPEVIDRVLRLEEQRRRLLGESERERDGIAEAVEKTLAALDLETADAALVALVRECARQIDLTVTYGTREEAAKVMYLNPHLRNGLHELGATPAARAELEAKVKAKSDDNGKRAKLQALRNAS